MGKQNSRHHNTLKINRGRISKINLFEITEDELEILAKGNSNDLFLNFSIFLLSIGLSGFIALATASFKNGFTEKMFNCISLVGLLMGFFLLLLWWRQRKSEKTLVERIKKRIN